MTDEQAKLLDRPIAAGAVCRCDERSTGTHICPRHGRIDLYAQEKTILALHEPKLDKGDPDGSR